MAKQWYSSIFEKDPYFDQPFYVGFNLAGYELGLLPKDGTKGAGNQTCTAYWGVKDISLACADLKAKGCSLLEEITDVGDGIKVATFTDVESNIVGLIENPHFPNTCLG